MSVEVLEDAVGRQLKVGNLIYFTTRKSWSGRNNIGIILEVQGTKLKVIYAKQNLHEEWRYIGIRTLFYGSSCCIIPRQGIDLSVEPYASLEKGAIEYLVSKFDNAQIRSVAYHTLHWV